MNSSFNAWFCIGFSCCLYFSTQTSCAQPKPTPKHVDLSVKKEKENLEVFHDWIRYNNPGSLLINHLNKQAQDLYETRDEEIARLKNRSDWANRQLWVREK